MPRTIAITHAHTPLNRLLQSGLVIGFSWLRPWYPLTSSALTFRAGIHDEYETFVIYTLVRKRLSRHKLPCRVGTAADPNGAAAVGLWHTVCTLKGFKRRVAVGTCAKPQARRLRRVTQL
jgi:hypothetical protein